MRLAIGHVGRGARVAYWGLLVASVAIVFMAQAPASATAAPCTMGSTSWLGGSGSFNEDANWSNGGPSGSCDTFITAAGAYTVSMTGGASMKSLTLGGAGSTPTLEISAAGPNTNLNATTTGIAIKAGAAVVLTCPGGGCNGGSGGGSSLNSGSSPFSNQGTITVDAASGTGATIVGPLVNTGTVQIKQDARMNNGAVVNQGTLSIADGKTLTSSGSSCGGTEVSFKNDAGGSIVTVGTGTLSVINYEQGNGTTNGLSPVNIPCGSLKYTGSGASKVQATGGFSLTGEIQPNQSLTVLSQSNNTNVTLGTDLVNKGSITLSCFPAVPPALSGCNGGDPGSGAGFNVSGHQFTNVGTLKVAADSGTGANIDSGSGGAVTNTGTMQFDQSARLSGLVVNKGTLNIADGKTVKASSSSCGSGDPLKNETGGSINATGTGTGTLEISTTYEQGNGTTSGSIPVSMPCGKLKYTGSAGAGASKVLLSGGFDLSGEMQAGQELTVTNNSPNTNLRLVSPFTSKGSITFTCPSSPCNGPGFNGNGNLFVNAGTFTVDAAASSGTTLDMSSGGMTNAAAGTFQLNGNTNFNGSGPLSNQGTLRIVAGANTPAFANAGTIVLDQSATNPFLNTGTLTNTGTIETSGPSANTSSVNGTIDQTGSSALTSIPAGTKLSVNSLLLKAGKLSGGGTLQGSANNSGGTVAPGASPGTLTVSGDYTQGADGKLEIEVAGTGVGQFDKLAIGGGATLNGTLALQPSAGYASSAALGDGIDFLNYGSARTGQFAQVTTTPSLACPKQFALDYNDGEKRVGVDVLDGPLSCGGGGNGGGGGGSSSNTPPVTSPPPPKAAPKPVKCKKGFRKVKVKGKSKCKKIKKKHGKR